MSSDKGKGKARAEETSRSGTATGSSPSEQDMSEQRQFERDGSSPLADDWSKEKDPNKRRRIQNKLAQRKFREKTKQQKEDRQRDLENAQRAGSSYSAPDPGEMGDDGDLAGLPWGSLSMKHVIETGKNKEKHSSQGSSAGPVHPHGGRGSGSRYVTSRRIGLNLMEDFARGVPAWELFPYSTYYYNNWSGYR